MAERVAYAPVPPSKPKISRDRTAVVLAIIAIMLFLWDADARNSWIQGRLNWGSQLHTSMCAVFLVQFGLGLALFIRVATGFIQGTLMQRVRWILLLVPSLLPCLHLALPVDWGINLDSLWPNRPGYASGFASWTQASIDAKSIRQWAATAPITPDERFDRDYGYTLQGKPGSKEVLVPEGSWPSSVISAKPKEVYVLTDRSATILEWPSGHFGWSRTVVIMASEDAPGCGSYYRRNVAGLPIDVRLDLGHGVWVAVSR